MHVRHADPTGDAEACACIYAPSVRDGVASFELVAPDRAVMARRIATVSATHPWLVAERDGGVAGFAYASPHREKAAYRWSVDVSIYVDARHQGAGVGRSLYEALFGLLVRQGMRRAFAGITLPNPGSVGLHETLGFRLIGVYEGVGYKHGAWRDVGWWQKDLCDDAGDDRPPAEPSGPQRLD